MSLDRYLVLRKAAEQEMIADRILFISDCSAAFSFDNKYTEKYLNKLNKKLTELEGIDDFSIHWKSDPDAAERMRRWQR